VFPQDYNVREYILRCVKQDFRKNSSLSGPALAEALKRVRRAPPAPARARRPLAAAHHAPHP
jgi:hypothetical protein